MDLAPRNDAEILRPLACDRLEDDAPLSSERLPEVRLRAGDATAPPGVLAVTEVEALYRKHHRFVFHIALRYGKRNTAWAEDVTQDVFLDLFRVVHTLTDLDDIQGWLYRATTNRCFKRLRRERLLDLAPVRWLLGERQPEPRPPDALAAARDDLRRAFEVLDALPLKEQMAFAMYYLDEKDQEEIGRILGHSKSYVCKLIQRASARLQQAGWEVNHA